MPDIGSAIGGASSIIGGVMQSDASTSAADTQAQSAAQAVDEQRRQFDVNQTNQQPWLAAGRQGLGLLRTMLTPSGPAGVNYANADYQRSLQDYQKAMDAYNAFYPTYQAQAKGSAGQREAATKVRSLESAVNDALAASKTAETAQKNAAGSANDPMAGYLLKPFTPGDLANEPGYQFGLKQGELGINRAASAGGRLLSGATLKALDRYNSDYAGTKYQEAYNRDSATKTDIYNRLAGLSGTGQVAANQVSAAGTNAANNISDLYTQQGNALAAGQVGSANAWGNAFSNIANQYQQSQLMNRLFPKTTVGSGSSGGSSSFFPFA